MLDLRENGSFPELSTLCLSLACLDKIDKKFESDCKRRIGLFAAKLSFLVGVSDAGVVGVCLLVVAVVVQRPVNRPPKGAREHRVVALRQTKTGL